MWTGIGLSLFLPMLLRPLWKDNRVHYAVDCASFGCPNLQPDCLEILPAKERAGGVY
jgi:hypothetical protein